MNLIHKPLSWVLCNYFLCEKACQATETTGYWSLLKSTGILCYDMLILLANNRCVVFMVQFPFLWSLAMEGVQMGALWGESCFSSPYSHEQYLKCYFLLCFDCWVVYKKMCCIETSSSYFGVQIHVHFPKKVWSKLCLTYLYMFCPSFWNLLVGFVSFKPLSLKCFWNLNQSVKHLNPFKNSRWK